MVFWSKGKIDFHPIFLFLGRSNTNTRKCEKPFLGKAFPGKQKGCWMRGDAVVVVKGELKNLKGFVENVKGDIVHIRPKDEKIPMKTFTVRGNELVKYFEGLRQVKVICGQLEGTTGMVVKVDQRKLVILSDATKDLITVFSAQVIESNEKSENSSKIGIIVCSNPDSRHDKISASRQLPQPAKSCFKPIPGSRPPSKLGHGTVYTWRKHDSFIGTRVKIVHGPYRGYRGCVKGVNGQNVRVELEAQMKMITGSPGFNLCKSVQQYVATQDRRRNTYASSYTYAFYGRRNTMANSFLKSSPIFPYSLWFKRVCIRTVESVFNDKLD